MCLPTPYRVGQDKKRKKNMQCLKPIIKINDPSINSYLNVHNKMFISYKWFKKSELSLNECLHKKQVLLLPCGQCYNCVNNRRYQWVKKMEYENHSWKNSYMITLTYDNEHLPKDKMLSVHDTQKFIKRLRKNLKIDFNYFLTGEYGTKTNRPHYHIILFTDYDFQLTRFKKTPKGMIFLIPEIEQIWKNGFCTALHCLTNEAFVYCASYSNKSFLKQNLNRRNKNFNNEIDELWKNGSSYKTYCLVSDFIENHFKTQYKPEFYTFSKKRPIGSRYENIDILPSSLIKYRYRKDIENLTGLKSSYKSFDIDIKDACKGTRAKDLLSKFNEFSTLYQYELMIREFKTFKILETNFKNYKKYLETYDVQTEIESVSAEKDAYDRKKIMSSTF